MNRTCDLPACYNIKQNITYRILSGQFVVTQVEYDEE
jgi:hypothetical protein